MENKTKRAKAVKTTAELAADVCLYGAPHCGYHYLGRLSGRSPLFGNGDPHEGQRPFSTASEALWEACGAIRGRGVECGTVRVFAPGGAMYADLEIGGHVPSFGSIDWKRAGA